MKCAGVCVVSGLNRTSVSPADQRKQTSHRRRRRTARRSCREFISPEGKIKLKRILQHRPQWTSDLIIIYLTPSSFNYIFSCLHLLLT